MNHRGKKTYLGAILSTIVSIVIVFIVLNQLKYKADINLLPPNTPSGLVAKDISPNRIDLQWTDNSIDEQGFRIEKSKLPYTGFTELSHVPANSIRYTDNITNGTRYYYRVSAIGKDQNNSTLSNIATPTRDEVKDLLIGIGDFSGYAPDQSGINVPTGWWFNCTQKTTDDHNSKEHCLSDIVKGNALSDSNQKIGLKDINSPSHNWSYIAKTYKISKDLNFGDTVKFKLDKISFQDFDIPTDSGLNAYMRIRSSYDGSNPIFTTSQPLDLTPDVINKEITYQLPGIPAGASQNEINLLKNTYNLIFEFVVDTKNTYNKEPSILINGAHIFVKKAGESDYATVQIPVSIDRNIKTQKIFFNPERDNLYETAKNFDAVMGDINDYSMPLMKFYNPNIKLYGYEGAWATDNRDSTYHDPSYNNVPMGFAWILDNHPDWLYEYPPQTTVLDPPGDNREKDAMNPGAGAVNQYKLFKNDGVTLLNYVFSPSYQSTYPLKISNESFKQTWKDNVLSSFQQNSLDGIFIDGFGLGTISGTKTEGDGTKSTVVASNTTPYESQNFGQTMIPALKSAGLETMVNQSGEHYNSWPGRAIFNPNWDPATEVAGQNNVPDDFNPANYLKNSFNNTADIFFQEHAYFDLNWQKDDLKNSYKLDYWEKSIKDLETLNEINKNSKTKKKVFQLSLNMDRPDIGDPALNPVLPADLADLSKYDTGWAKFALGSYLLSSNDYSYLGVSSKVMVGIDWNSYADPIDPGIDSASQLGQSIESRIIYESRYSDKSLQSRKFSNGLVIANGSPDQERTLTLQNDMLDDLGRLYNTPELKTITLKPHTARILFNLPTAEAKITNSPAQRHGYYIEAPTISLSPLNISGNTVLSIRYKIDNEIEKQYNSTVVIPEGIHILSYYALDAEGHAGQIKTETYKVKSSPPKNPKLLNKSYSDSLDAYITFKSSFNVECSLEPDVSKITLSGEPDVVVGGEFKDTIKNLPTGQKISKELLAEDFAGNNSKTDFDVLRLKPGDSNNDSKIDIHDFSILLSRWNTAGVTADFNEDGTVNIKDFSILLSNWGK